MNEWFVGVTAASILSAIALELCPPGRVRSITRLVCGIVCALAVVSPALQLDVGTLSAAMTQYERDAQKIAEDAEEEKKMLERTYIEEQCAAYISDKAARLGLVIDGVSVLARWDEDAHVWYPWQARLGCAENAELSRAIEADLGVPAERQIWEGE